MQGNFDGIEEQLEPFFQFLANHIVKERQRLGGDFAVAQAVFSRKQRNMLRQIIGPDLVFMVMNMTKESQVERLKKRHAGSVPDSFLEVMIKYAELCEPAGEDEPNTFNVNITGNMSKEDVVREILDIANKIK